MGSNTNPTIALLFFNSQYEMEAMVPSSDLPSSPESWVSLGRLGTTKCWFHCYIHPSIVWDSSKRRIIIICARSFYENYPPFYVTYIDTHFAASGPHEVWLTRSYEQMKAQGVFFPTCKSVAMIEGAPYVIAQRAYQDEQGLFLARLKDDGSGELKWQEKVIQQYRDTALGTDKEFNHCSLLNPTDNIPTFLYTFFLQFSQSAGCILWSIKTADVPHLFDDQPAADLQPCTVSGIAIADFSYNQEWWQSWENTIMLPIPLAAMIITSNTSGDKYRLYFFFIDAATRGVRMAWVPLRSDGSVEGLSSVQASDNQLVQVDGKPIKFDLLGHNMYAVVLSNHVYLTYGSAAGAMVVYCAIQDDGTLGQWAEVYNGNPFPKEENPGPVWILPVLIDKDFI